MSARARSREPVRLVLLRHAPAQHRDPSRWPDDADRPLRPSGRKEFARSAQGLARLLDGRGVAVTSPLKRAHETNELLGRHWKPALEPWVWPELRPEIPARDVLGRVARSLARSRGSMVLIGHEPQFSRLVGLATTGEAASVVRFSKGGAIAIDFDAALVPGGGKIAWALTRSQLSRLARTRPGPDRDLDEE